MRSFIAINLPQETKNLLAGIQERLKKTQLTAKWVLPGNLHLTLKFLGEINEEQYGKILGILETVANNQATFLLKITSLGAFPRIISPRIIWVGIEKGKEETEKIAKELEEQIEKIGIPKEERGFSSHITLARVKSISNRKGFTEELNKLALAFPQDLEFKVDKISLMKSSLSIKGPTYEILKEVNLKIS
jgi:2'-5' RNA ligase